MEELIYIIITAIASVASGILVFMLKNVISSFQKKETTRAEEKSKKDYLILRILDALGKLTVANSIALRDGKTNGELSEALSEYTEIEKELYQYLISTNTRTT